ncbi:MAG: FmdE family protein [Collinsella sp.]|nr:FmdE family protein [Collinsella sp.]
MLKRTLQEDLDRAVAFHGHLCGGQMIGTRMARLALEYFHIEDPDTYRDLVAFVECDRCLADAIISVAHCHLGKRRLKWFDYGIMSASFHDLATGRTIRISQREDVPRCPAGGDLMEHFGRYSDEELFHVHRIELVGFDELDLPGKPRVTQICASCGERIHDGRGVDRDGRVLCKRCAGEPVYYVEGAELTPEQIAAGA